MHDYHAWVLFMNRRYQEALEALGSEMEGTRGYFAAETLAMTNAELDGSTLRVRRSRCCTSAGPPTT